MANRIITVNPNIKVLGYDDFMKPLMQLQKEHDLEKAKIEQEEDVLLSMLGKLNAYKDTDENWKGADKTTAIKIQEQLDNLQNLSDRLSKVGIRDITLSKDARSLRKNIIPMYTKYSKALETREKELSRLDDNHRYSIDLRNKDLEYFTDTTNLGYDKYKIQEFNDAGKDIMQRYNSMQLPTITHEKTDRPDKKLLTITQGISEMPTVGDDYDKLLAEAKKYVESRGVFEDSNDSLYRELVNDVMEGMSGGLATPKYSVVEDATYTTNYRNNQNEYKNKKLKEDAYTGMFVNVPTYYDDDNNEYSEEEEKLLSSTKQVETEYYDQLSKLKNEINKDIKKYLTEEATEDYDELIEDEASDDEINKFLSNKDNYRQGTEEQRNSDVFKHVQKIEALEEKLKYIEKGYYYDNKGNRYSKGTKESRDASQGMAGASEVFTSKDSNGRQVETYTMDSNFNSFADIEKYNVKNIKARIENDAKSWLDANEWSDTGMPKIEIYQDGKNYKMRIIYNPGTSSENKKLQKDAISYALLNINYNK